MMMMMMMMMITVMMMMMTGRVPLKYLGRDTDSQVFREQSVDPGERAEANTVKL